MTSTPPTPGPKLLEERSLGGILIHFLAIPTGVVGAGILYLLATDEFTKRNARNALDWHLTVLLITAITFGSVLTYAELTGQGVTDVSILSIVCVDGRRHRYFGTSHALVCCHGLDIRCRAHRNGESHIWDGMAVSILISSRRAVWIPY